MGAVGGRFVARLRMPSIVVTLALMVAWRDGLRWITEGSGSRICRQNFQWFGLGQTRASLDHHRVAVAVLIVFGWALRKLKLGRAVYAVGSDAEAARLAGIEPQRVIFGVFVLMGALVGLAALLNAVRFSIVPEQCGNRSRTESDRRGGSWRNGDHWWPRRIGRDADRRGTAGHDRHGADICRHQSVLGESDSGSDHSRRRWCRMSLLGRLHRFAADCEFWTCGLRQATVSSHNLATKRRRIAN